MRTETIQTSTDGVDREATAAAAALIDTMVARGFNVERIAVNVGRMARIAALLRQATTRGTE